MHYSSKFMNFWQTHIKKRKKYIISGTKHPESVKIFLFYLSKTYSIFSCKYVYYCSVLARGSFMCFLVITVCHLFYCYLCSNAAANFFCLNNSLFRQFCKLISHILFNIFLGKLQTLWMLQSSNTHRTFFKTRGDQKGKGGGDLHFQVCFSFNAVNWSHDITTLFKITVIKTNT